MRYDSCRCARVPPASARSPPPISEFAAREKGYTFVSHQQEVGAGYFDDVTTVIQGGASSVTALTGSTEEEQFYDENKRAVA